MTRQRLIELIQEEYPPITARWLILRLADRLDIPERVQWRLYREAKRQAEITRALRKNPSYLEVARLEGIDVLQAEQVVLHDQAEAGDQEEDEDEEDEDA